MQAQEHLLPVVVTMSWRHEQTPSFNNTFELLSSEVKSFCDFIRLLWMSLVSIVVSCWYQDIDRVCTFDDKNLEYLSVGVLIEITLS